MKYSFSIIFLFVFCFNGFSQPIVNQIRYSNAEKFIYQGDFSKAIPIYRSLLAHNPKNPDLNFKLGFCYLNTVKERQKSIQYFESAIKSLKTNAKKSRKVPVDAYYYLGRAYHLNYKFDDAIKIYDELKSRLRLHYKFKKEIDRQIEFCKHGETVMNNTMETTVCNLGASINSKYTDHSPLVSADESVLIFTSQRRGSSGGKMSYDNQYYEDIYISYKEKGKWSKPKRISKNINSKGHDAACSLSPDGTKLFLYKRANLYVSNLNGKTWTKPKKLKRPINTLAYESHASISADEKTLYFTSTRRKGFGGIDIYSAQKKENGKWGNVKNLGQEINSQYDEECPFIHADGKTLYFNSKGHNSMGGFDVFKSAISSDGSYSKAVNLGYPISTSGNDVFFTPTADNQKAYYSSQQTSGSGEKDLYQINIFDESNTNLVLMKGTVLNEQGKATDATQITVTDIDTENEITEYFPNFVTGKYLFVLSKKNYYNFYFESNGYLPYFTNISWTADNLPQKLNKDVKLKIIEIGKTNEKYKSTISKNENDTVINKSTIAILKNLANFISNNDAFMLDVSLSENFQIETKTTKRIDAIIDLLNTYGVAQSRLLFNLSTEAIDDNAVLFTVLDTITKDAAIKRKQMLIASNQLDNKETDPKNIDINETKNKPVIISNILFEVNKYETTKYYNNLDKLTEYLVENTEAKIEIGGFTDPQGRMIYNRFLAEKRAEFVKNYLIKKGVNSEQLITKNYGSERQISIDIYGKYTKEALKYNRRVEFTVLTPGKTPIKIKQIEVPESFMIKN